LKDDVKQINIVKIKDETCEETLDSVVVEMPLKLYVNYELYTVLMCTPNEVKELAIGYLFSEGIISSLDSIESIEEKFDDRVCIVLKDDIKVNYDSIKAEASGCGSGRVQLKFLELGLDTAVESDYKVSSVDILKLMKEFNRASELFIKTGGVHSCAICKNEGITVFSEDIGRHNALDKVIGKSIINNISLKDKFVMTTGRISSDIVVKTVKAGIPILVSHSAPTDLAIDMAKASNLTVIGFVRGNRMTVYCRKDRVIIC
jgi:FdhD protein